MYNRICDAIHTELEKLDEKYEKDVQMSMADLDAVDKMFHALKCLKTYEAMEEPRRRRYEEDTRYRRY